MSIASFFPPSRRAAIARTLLAAALAGSGSLALAADYYLVVPNPAKAHVVELPPADPIVVTLAPGALPGAQVAQPYSTSLAGFLSITGDNAYDGSGVGWSLGALGALPAGLTLGADGTISGTPTAVSPGEGESFETVASYKGESGQQVYTIKVTLPSGQVAYTTAGTFTWTVPAGVTSVSVVAVGGGNGAGSTATASGTSHFNNSLYAYGSSNTTGGGFAGADGGGKGGNGGAGYYYYEPGGYYQDYWSGEIYYQSPTGPYYYGGGSGGGAGGYSSKGGIGGAGNGNVVPGYGGGGVGLLGGSAGGAGGAWNVAGVGGSGGANGRRATSTANAGGGLYGGGHGGWADGYSGVGNGYGGGGLGYKNAIAVTPGQQIPVKVGIGGAVRIIWPGNVRQFPSTRTADE